MRAAVELALNGWVFGLPIVLLTWASLRLLHRAAARLRYVLVVAAFVAAMAMPLIPREVRVAVTEGSATETVADVMTFPMTLLWVIGAAVLLTREIVGHMRLHGAREDAPAELRRLLEWPDRIPLAVSDRAPLTIGLLRPRVVLPRDIAVAFPLAVAKHIARHELSHRRWRDPLVYALMRIGASLFWLWPLWPLLRWARREREVAADEFALRSAGGEEEHYVAALLRLAHVQMSAGSAMAASDLEFRARRILGVAQRSSIALTMFTFSAGLTLMLIAEPLGVDPPEPIVVVRNAGVPPAERAASPPPPSAEPKPAGETPAAQPARRRRPAPEPEVEVTVHRHVAVHRHVVDSQENE